MINPLGSYSRVSESQEKKPVGTFQEMLEALGLQSGKHAGFYMNVHTFTYLLSQLYYIILKYFLSFSTLQSNNFGENCRPATFSHACFVPPLYKLSVATKR